MIVARALGIAAWIVVLFILGPLIVIIGGSFTTTPFVAFPPQGFTLHWYRQLAGHLDFLRSFVDSVGLGVVATIGAALLGTPAALGLRHGSARSRAILHTIVMAPLTLPTIVTGVALLQFYYAIDLEVPLLALAAGHVLITVPYVVRTVGAGLEAFDPAIEEAAESLGAGGMRVLFKVTLPAIMPSIFAAMIFVFITSFDQVTISIFLSSPDLTPLPVRIYNYIAFAIDPMLAAVSTVLILLAFAMIAGLQRLLGLERVFSGDVT
jgi:putative spermidine/putrescine transport system permease protein